MMMDAANVALMSRRAHGSVIAGPFARRMRDIPGAANESSESRSASDSPTR